MTLKKQHKIYLVLFFTRGLSLQRWDSTGMLHREVALYRKLQQRGLDITFITYGDKKDLDYGAKFPGINICCNRWNIAPRIYEKLIPLLHWRQLRKADIVKSNQTDGADIACRAARRFGVPFIARCGYMWSDFVIRERGEDADFSRHTLTVEEEVFTSAGRIIVTTEEMAGSIRKRFPALANRITIIPNYVDTGLFKPSVHEEKSRDRLCFAGRLVPQKNLPVLFQAIKGLDFTLDIIGDGPMRNTLEKEVAQNGNIHFHGRVPNEVLPELFHRSTAFVLPSLYEGHPKTLIEAMACGLPVIATDVPGIRELIIHDRTGWLCRPDGNSLRTAVEKVMADRALRARLGKSARNFVENHFSLEKVVDMEIQVYRSALEEANGIVS